MCLRQQALNLLAGKAAACKQRNAWANFLVGPDFASRALMMCVLQPVVVCHHDWLLDLWHCASKQCEAMPGKLSFPSHTMHAQCHLCIWGLSPYLPYVMAGHPLSTQLSSHTYLQSHISRCLQTFCTLQQLYCDSYKTGRQPICTL